jgi:hypothetical protein
LDLLRRNGCIAHFWGLDDVCAAAAGRGRTLSDAEAMAVLEAMERRIDSETGLTWDPLHACLDEALGEEG